MKSKCFPRKTDANNALYKLRFDALYTRKGMISNSLANIIPEEVYESSV